MNRIIKTVTDEYKSTLDTFVKRNIEILGENLVGIYLHGSATLGCFKPNISDLDLIIVINSNISDQIMKLARRIKMQENKYDHPLFFEKYSQMERSKNGLAGAGEWETLKRILPEFQNKHVLDLGCGYGWHCIYAMEKGASSVIGVDLSQKMLEVAKQKTKFKEVEYICQSIEDVEFPIDSFDIIISSLVFHYISDYKALIKKIYQMLKPGGELVFTVEHPIYTAHGSQDWCYNEAGEKAHFPLDHYFYEGKRETTFLGEKVLKQHRTLTTYLNTLILAGFTIQQVVEPVPSDNMLHDPEMKNELRRPMMLIVSAIK